MPWLQLKFDIHPDKADDFSDLLMETGAVSVTLEDAADQPIFEPPPGEMQLWSSTRIVGLYTEDTSAEEVLNQIKELLAPEPVPPHTQEQLEDKVWERVWMDEFQPIQFGEKLWICPSWCEPPESDAVNIRLDPGLAFGTGTHPTTALCLQWLDSNPPSDINVIDYGCGSGILAVAAAMLGAKHVWAIDHDPQAILATNENAQVNEVRHLISAGDATITPSQPTDLLLANILAQPLIEFAPKFSQLVKPSGQIVLSGILEHQASSVVTAYQEHFELDPVSRKEEWVRITGKRRA